MSNKVKSVKASLTTELRRTKKEAKAAIADLQRTLESTSCQLRNSEGCLRNHAAVMERQKKTICILCDQLGEADLAKLDIQNEMIDKLAAADDRNKNVLSIIARFVSGQAKMQDILLILTQLGTTVPNELIDADLLQVSNTIGDGKTRY